MLELVQDDLAMCHEEALHLHRGTHVFYAQKDAFMWLVCGTVPSYIRTRNNLHTKKLANKKQTSIKSTADPVLERWLCERGRLAARS